MLRLLRSEVFRLRRRWMPWVLLFMVVAASLAIYVLVYFSVQTQLEAIRSGTTQNPGGSAQLDQALASLRPSQVANFGLGVVDGLGSVLLIVLTASVFGNAGTSRRSPTSGSRGTSVPSTGCPPLPGAPRPAGRSRRPSCRTRATRRSSSWDGRSCSWPSLSGASRPGM